jgi:hypothetical protein
MPLDKNLSIFIKDDATHIDIESERFTLDKWINDELKKNIFSAIEIE